MSLHPAPVLSCPRYCCSSPILWMPELLPGCEQKGRRGGGGTKPFLLLTTWLHPQHCLGGLPGDSALAVPTPEHGAVPVLLRECSLEEQLPGFLPPTSTFLQEDPHLFTLMPGPLSRAPAGSQELLLMGCQGIWDLRAGC